MTSCVAPVLVLALGVSANVRADSFRLPCSPDPAETTTLASSLEKRTGHPVEIVQACSADHGGFVAFTFTGKHDKTAQVARCNARATCSIIETWRDIRNCDSGMCDHFSTIDELLIASTADVDRDGKADALLDYATITGDQGRESHRLALWLSKKQSLQQLDSFEGQVELVEAVSTGIAVTARDWISGTSTRRCFDQRGMSAACPK